MGLLRNTLVLLLVFVGSVTFFAAQDWLSKKDSAEEYYVASPLYDWGFFGTGSLQKYQSFAGTVIKPNVIQTNDRCTTGMLFVEPHTQLGREPFMVFDNKAKLVWLPSNPKWKTAREVKVQKLNGESYITFVYGAENSADGQEYALVDTSYRLHKTIKPVGVRGHLSGLRITMDGTALVIIHKASARGHTRPRDDTMFQEIDVGSGQLLFEWRASHSAHTRNADPIRLQSVDKDGEGNYLLSSGNMVFCISGENKKVLWQLGGDGGDFKDGSGGSATALSNNHHASWHDNTTLFITNHRYGSHKRDYSVAANALMRVRLLFDTMTATVIDSANPPPGVPDAVNTFQQLDNGNILAQDVTTSSVIEASANETLCEVHFSPSRLSSMWSTKYHVTKHEWSARPQTSPDIAVRPQEGAVYVSWNGATDVDSWILQSGPEKEGTLFIDHVRVSKTGFETRIELPRRAEEYIRVVALDKKWNLAAYSRIASRHVDTGVERPEPQVFGLVPAVLGLGDRVILLILVVGIAAYCYIGSCLPLIRSLWSQDSRSRKDQ